VIGGEERDGVVGDGFDDSGCCVGVPDFVSCVIVFFLV